MTSLSYSCLSLSLAPHSDAGRRKWDDTGSSEWFSSDLTKLYFRLRMGDDDDDYYCLALGPWEALESNQKNRSETLSLSSLSLC